MTQRSTPAFGHALDRRLRHNASLDLAAVSAQRHAVRRRFQVVDVRPSDPEAATMLSAER